MMAMIHYVAGTKRSHCFTVDNIIMTSLVEIIFSSRIMRLLGVGALSKKQRKFGLRGKCGFPSFSRIDLKKGCLYDLFFLILSS